MREFAITSVPLGKPNAIPFPYSPQDPLGTSTHHKFAFTSLSLAIKSQPLVHRNGHNLNLRPPQTTTEMNISARAHRHIDIAIFLYDFSGGGVVRVAIHLANNLKRRGLAVELIVVRKQGLTLELLDSNIPVNVLAPSFGAGSRSYQIFRRIPDMVAFLRRRKPALLLSPGNHLNISAWIAKSISGQKDTKLAVKLTNPIIQSKKGFFQRKINILLYYLCMKSADAILAISKDGVKEAEHFIGTGNKKIHFVHNLYIEKSDYRSFPKIKSSATQHIKLLTVGRLTKQKDYATLFCALAKIKNKAWELDILGEGPDHEELVTLAKKLQISERIHFRGFILDPRPWFENADIFVSSSLYEGAPAVILEALSFELPIVATASCQLVSDLLNDSRFGQIVPVGDAEKLSVALNQSLETKWDMTGALEIVHRFSIENGTDEHLEAMQPLMKG